MFVDDKMMIYLEQLSMLAFTEQEREEIKQAMGQMLTYFDKLKELDMEYVEPMYQAYTLNNVFREDEMWESEVGKALVNHAPKRQGNWYQVPKAVD